MVSDPLVPLITTLIGYVCNLPPPPFWLRLWYSGSVSFSHSFLQSPFFLFPFPRPHLFRHIRLAEDRDFSSSSDFETRPTSLSPFLFLSAPLFGCRRDVWSTPILFSNYHNLQSRYLPSVLFFEMKIFFSSTYNSLGLDALCSLLSKRPFLHLLCLFRLLFRYVRAPSIPLEASRHPIFAEDLLSSPSWLSLEY